MRVEQSSKIILCADRAVPAGKRVRARVVRVNGRRAGEGFIEAEYPGRRNTLRVVEFQMDLNIYIGKTLHENCASCSKEASFGNHRGA
jgi:hypothetical protein